MSFFDESDTRSLVAQAAARLIYEEGINDYAHAKRKAIKSLGLATNAPLPTNHEIDHAIKMHHDMVVDENHPAWLHQLRVSALMTMRLFERFKPMLTGSVLDGIVGEHAVTEIHLFAESSKEVEIFMLNQQIPFEVQEKSYRFSDKPSKDKSDKIRRSIPVITLETEYGLQKLSIFEVDGIRSAPRKSDSSAVDRINIKQLEQLLQ